MKVKNVLLILVISLGLVSRAEAQDHWVATWVAAPQQVRVFTSDSNPNRNAGARRIT